MRAMTTNPCAKTLGMEPPSWLLHTSELPNEARKLLQTTLQWETPAHELFDKLQTFVAGDSSTANCLLRAEGATKPWHRREPANVVAQPGWPLWTTYW